MHFTGPDDVAGFQSALLDIFCSSTDEFIGVMEVFENRFIYINERGATMFGYQSADEMISKNALQTGNEILSLEKIETIRKAIKSNENYSEELEYKNINTKIFYGLLVVNTFSYNDKFYLFVRIRNIDLSKKSDSNLVLEKERFEALFNYATMGILVADSSGSVILANNFSTTQFGYNHRNELTGKKVEELIPSRYRQQHLQNRETYNKNPYPRSMGVGMDLFALKKDGSEFPVEISLSNFKTTEGSFVIAFVIDITKRKEIEKSILSQQAEIKKLNDELEDKVELRTQQLTEAMQQLEASKEELSKSLNKEKELGDMKSRFVSMASHEFRTPLSTILSSASLLAKYTLSEEQEKRDKHIHRIKSSVNNLTDILNEFLSIGKIEDGKILANMSEFNLQEFIKNISNDLQGNLKRGQKIVYYHEGSKTVCLDPSLMRNIIINLVSNAVKFSPENAEIIITTDVSENETVLAVKDNGIGISDEDQQHLTERFFRGANATNIQGTGLGLHIVSRYAELMNGQLEFKSELEKGTEIIIKFNV